MAPARLPGDIAARLNREIVSLLRTQPVREKLLAQGRSCSGARLEEFAALLRNDIRKWPRSRPL